MIGLPALYTLTGVVFAGWALATMLERLERAHGEKSSKSDKGGKDGKGGDDIKVPRYLLTHPHTEERIAAIRAAR